MLRDGREDILQVENVLKLVGENVLGRRIVGPCRVKGDVVGLATGVKASTAFGNTYLARSGQSVGRLFAVSM